MSDTRAKDRRNLGFYRGRLSDSDRLYEIIDQEKYPLAIAQNIYRLKNPDIYVFFNDTNDAMIIYEPTYGSVPWVNTHSHTLKSARGRKLKEFYLRTGVWIFENTPFEVITAIIPWDMRHHGLFLGMIGAKRQGEAHYTTIYTFDKSQVKEVKETLRWKD